MKKDLNTFIKSANDLASKKIPFFFLIDFEMKNPVIFRLDETLENNILYEIKGKKNHNTPKTIRELNNISYIPIDKKQYYNAIEKALVNINKGNSYLLNLTFPTEINIDNNLKEIFHNSVAPYKLYYKDRFIVFSPECFVRIKDDYIYSYPMKGTIDASIPNAEKLILENKKELYEHNTIVDLIRNDLSIVSTEVDVTKFRYIDTIKSNTKKLLQVSSEIRGKLDSNWKNTLGEILIKLLPAGSISGAPKQKTVGIIQDIESETRGYYTGIFGVFDGINLDSAVNIRFIESTKTGYRYRSGGGITSLSDKTEEYQELLNKIYVPSF